MPDTHIDSLYTAYIDSDGPKKALRANNLLEALYEEEMTDTLIQFSTNEKIGVIEAHVNYWMAEYFYCTSRYNEAESAGRIALENAKDVEDEYFEIDIYSFLGSTCQRLGKNEEALGYMQKCYEASSKSGNLEEQSSDLSNLAVISLSLNNTDLAKAYIDRAIEVERSLDRDNVLAIRYGIASEVYEKLGELEAAENFARDAYALDINGGREGKAAIRLSQLAGVLITKGEKDEALQILLQAVPPLVENGNNYSLAVVESQLGALYLERGDDSQSAEHYRAAYNASKECGNLHLIQRSLTGLANSFKNIDIDSAYNYLTESVQVADSIAKLNNSKELAIIEGKYRESEALRESELRVYERKVQNYVLMIILSLSLLAISFLFFIIRGKNKEQRLLKNLEKMRTTFFTNITHEFRTPLTLIMGLSNDISRDSNSSKEVKEAAGVISSQGEGLLELVNQLLDISKVQSEIGNPDWRHGNVVNYMHMIAEKYRHSATSAGIDIAFSPAENVIVMDFVPHYINKILRNLISNALKFTPKGGRIYITTGVKDNKLVLRVADTGVGIDEADLPHIFELYYQGDNGEAVVGTGLGLAMVERMVKAMNGEISVKSVKGKGTIFTLLLPLTHNGVVKKLDEPKAADNFAPDSKPSDIADETDSENASVEETVTAGNEKPIVLVVEDNAEVASYIGNSLTDYNVHYARNGREGLDKAKELIPDLVVTDMMMPEMNGIEMTAQIREDAALNHVPVVMITARADEADRIIALKTGVDAYLVKPFNRDELVVRVSQLIMQRRMLCEKYQRALAAGNVENEDMPVADRQFISNMVGVVYGMLAKGDTTDLEIVASKMNMSSRTFSRKLQALTGDTPLLYINKIKVGKAKSIIDTDTSISLSDVAYQCGFETLSYFSRIFKQIEGVSPTAYRRSVK